MKRKTGPFHRYNFGTNSCMPYVTTREPIRMFRNRLWHTGNTFIDQDGYRTRTTGKPARVHTAALEARCSTCSSALFYLQLERILYIIKPHRTTSYVSTRFESLVRTARLSTCVSHILTCYVTYYIYVHITCVCRMCTNTRARTRAGHAAVT